MKNKWRSQRGEIELRKTEFPRQISVYNCKLQLYLEIIITVMSLTNVTRKCSKFQGNLFPKS